MNKITVLFFVVLGLSALAATSNLEIKLNRKCGKQFDGVNATYVPGLRRSYRIRKNKSSYPGKSKEMKELSCRIRYLEKNR